MTEARTVPEHPVRFVTAASLFDGHDASINIMRRILQAQGAEVIHLGHNRSVDEVVDAAVQEDVQGVAISSYQGGHVEYFTYLRRALREAGAGRRPDLRRRWRRDRPRARSSRSPRAACRIFSPEDGQRLGLAGMINTMVADVRRRPLGRAAWTSTVLLAGEPERAGLGDQALRSASVDPALLDGACARPRRDRARCSGITGTGGSGKSSLTDELLRRFRLDQEDKLRIAVIAIDPTRRRAAARCSATASA